MNNDNKVRNAVVRIKYHNYTCTHLIFVRRGYDPRELMPSADCMDFTTRKGDSGEFNGEYPCSMAHLQHDKRKP